MVDQRRVEALLGADHRLDDVPDGAGETAAPARGRRPGRRQHVPRLVERRDLVLVGAGRRMGQRRQALHRLIQGGQRGVVAGVGGVTLGLEPGQIGGRDRPRDLAHRPTTPSTGLLAVA